MERAVQLVEAQQDVLAAVLFACATLVIVDVVSVLRGVGLAVLLACMALGRAAWLNSRRRGVVQGLARAHSLGHSRLERLPHEIRKHLLEFLNERDLVVTSRVSKAWRALALNDRLWQRVVSPNSYAQFRQGQHESFVSFIGRVRTEQRAVAQALEARRDRHVINARYVNFNHVFSICGAAFFWVHAAATLFWFATVAEFALFPHLPVLQIALVALYRPKWRVFAALLHVGAAALFFLRIGSIVSVGVHALRLLITFLLAALVVVGGAIGAIHGGPPRPSCRAVIFAAGEAALFALAPPLLAALSDWRPELHTFILPAGEATFYLLQLRFCVCIFSMIATFTFNDLGVNLPYRMLFVRQLLHSLGVGFMVFSRRIEPSIAFVVLDTVFSEVLLIVGGLVVLLAVFLRHRPAERGIAKRVSFALCCMVAYLIWRDRLLPLALGTLLSLCFVAGTALLAMQVGQARAGMAWAWALSPVALFFFQPEAAHIRPVFHMISYPLRALIFVPDHPLQLPIALFPFIVLLLCTIPPRIEQARRAGIIVLLSLAVMREGVSLLQWHERMLLLDFVTAPAIVCLVFVVVHQAFFRGRGMDAELIEVPRGVFWAALAVAPMAVVRFYRIIQPGDQLLRGTWMGEPATLSLNLYTAAIWVNRFVLVWHAAFAVPRVGGWAERPGAGRNVAVALLLAPIALDSALFFLALRIHFDILVYGTLGSTIFCLFSFYLNALPNAPLPRQHLRYAALSLFALALAQGLVAETTPQALLLPPRELLPLLFRASSALFQRPFFVWLMSWSHPQAYVLMLYHRLAALPLALLPAAWCVILLVADMHWILFQERRVRAQVA